MRQRPRWQAYGAQQRSVALQVVVLHFDPTDVASPAVAAVPDTTIPAYAHTHTTNRTSSDRIVRFILPPLSGANFPRVTLSYQPRIALVKGSSF